MSVAGIAMTCTCRSIGPKPKGRNNERGRLERQIGEVLFVLPRSVGERANDHLADGLKCSCQTELR